MGAAVRRAARRDRGRRRAGADRPPGASLSPGFVVTPGRARLVPARATTRATSRRSSPSATRPCWRRCRATSSSRCSSPACCPEAYLAKLRGIEYFTALCLLIELDRQFSPYYWTNIGDDALPFVGLIEHTNLIPPERYDGRRFLYVANYLPRGHELLDLDADGLLERYTAGLRAVNPGSIARWVKQLWLHREPAAQPIVTVGYRDKIPPMKTPRRGLVLANTTQIFPEDRGTNYAVREGDEAARALLDWLPSVTNVSPSRIGQP